MLFNSCLVIGCQLYFFLEHTIRPEHNSLKLGLCLCVKVTIVYSVNRVVLPFGEFLCSQHFISFHPQQHVLQKHLIIGFIAPPSRTLCVISICKFTLLRKWTEEETKWVYCREQVQFPSLSDFLLRRSLPVGWPNFRGTWATSAQFKD